MCISEMGSCEDTCVFVKRPNKTVISAYNAFKCEYLICVLCCRLYDPEEKRIQSVFNDEHVSVCSALL